MTKVALGPRMWVVAYVRGPKHEYVGTLLRTQAHSCVCNYGFRDIKNANFLQ